MGGGGGYNDPMELASPKDGWMVSNAGEELWVTHDGAKSWQQIRLTAPAAVAPANRSATYGLPVFAADSKRGFVQVTFSGGTGLDIKSAVVLFDTDDGGRTWKPDRIVKNLRDSSRTKYSLSTVVGSNWIFVARSDVGLVLTNVGAGASIDASADAGAAGSRYRDIDQLSFVTPTRGWVSVNDDELQATTDGGVSWTNITPRPKP